MKFQKRNHNQLFLKETVSFSGVLNTVAGAFTLEWDLAHTTPAQSRDNI